MKLFFSLVMLLLLFGCNRKFNLKQTADLKQTIQVFDTVSRDSKNIINDFTEGSFECGVRINVSKNWIELITANGGTQKITYPNQVGPKYKLICQLITPLDPKKYYIKSCMYTPITGGVSDFKFQRFYPSICNDMLVTEFYIQTYKKTMTGKMTVRYAMING